MEASQKNFGLASQHSTQFFNTLRDVLPNITNPERQQRLKEILEMRDPVTAGIASAAPAVLWELQGMVRKVHENTRD